MTNIDLIQCSSPLFGVWESYNANLILEVILLKGSGVKALVSVTRRSNLLHVLHISVLKSTVHETALHKTATTKQSHTSPPKLR